MKSFLLIFIIINGSIVNLFSQVDSIRYTKNFRFVEGIYRSYKEFKSNNPSIKRESVISEQLSLQELINGYKGSIEYYDNDNIKKIKRDNIWGCSSDGLIYMLYKDDYQSKKRLFFKFEIIGSIIYYIEATAIFYRPSTPSPGIAMGTITNSGVNVGISGGGQSRGKPKFKPYLIDFKTGTQYLYNLNNFLILLKKDKELYDEFMFIKGNKNKKIQMLTYLKKFNERNPIYFKTY